MQYHAVIHKDEDTDYGVIVPDLPGCYSAGDSLEDAALNAREAIECHIEGMLIDGEPVPPPSTLDTLAHKKKFKGGVWVLVDINLVKLSGKIRRVNITLPERILKQIDTYSAIHGSNRSAFLSEAALEFINAHR